MNQLNSKYQLAIQQAIEWINVNYQPLAIIISGSIIRGNSNQNSDLDIYVIHEESFRQRVQKYFNEVPCEIFINNPTHIQSYFEIELKKNRSLTAHMLATGIVVSGNDNPVIKDIISTAKKYVSLAPPLSDEAFVSIRYAIAIQFEDAEEILTADPITAQYILDKIMIELIELLFQLHKMPMPRVKDRIAGIKDISAFLHSLVVSYYRTNDAETKLELVLELITNTTRETGFFEWASSKSE